MRHESEGARAEALVDALPFIQRFRGQTFVVKYGGSAMEDDHLIERLLKDVVFLEAVGINPVLIHGGGKAITQRMRQSGLAPRFVHGLRVTDAVAIKIVEEVLDEVIRPRIVETIRQFGGKAKGFSGRDIFRAERTRPQNEGGTMIDLGFVGEVVSLNSDPVRVAIENEVMPVISPIGRGSGGETLNVNADYAAGALAGALKASKVIYVSDVLGVMRDIKEPASLIPTLNRESAQKLMANNIIEGGMVPKVSSALAAIQHGVGKVHLIDGRIPHALLLEIFTPEGIGTEIVA